MIFGKHSIKELLLFGCLVVAAATAASCQRDALEIFRLRPLGGTTYTVTFEPSATKATLGSDYIPVWEIGEQVSVYDPVAERETIFTVTEVDGNSATIRGDISEGDFAFSAVYPASAVDAWVDASTCLWSVPTEQTIPSGGRIAPDAMVSAALNQSGDIVFHNQTALLDFTVGETDISSVTFNIGEEEYIVSAGTGTLVKDSTYHLAVLPGQYKGVSTTATTIWDVSYGRQSDNTLEAERNTYVNLGSLTANSTKRYGYQIYSEGTYSSLGDLLDISGYLDDLSSLERFGVELVLWPLVPKKEKDMHIYRYTYTSEGPSGKPVKMSSLIYVFEDAVSGSATLDGISLVNHETITTDSNCPTNFCSIFGAIAWKNHAAISPDYLGFGVSVQYPQVYLIADLAARHNMDAYFAGEQILKDKGIKYGSDRYTMGYSQGGYNAVDNLRYTSLHPELGVRFNKTFAGDGPYDVPASLKDYFSGNYDPCNAYIGLSILSMVDYGTASLKYSDILKGPILTNYYDWYVSKTRSASYIRARMGADVTDFVREDIIDGTSPLYGIIMEEAQRNCRI